LRDLSFGLDENRFVGELASAVAVVFGTLQSVFLAATMLGERSARSRAAVFITRGVSRPGWYLSRATAVLAASALVVFAVHLAAAGFTPATNARSTAVTAVAIDLLRNGLTASFAVLATALCENLLLAGSVTLGLVMISSLLPVVCAAGSDRGWAMLAGVVPPLPMEIPATAREIATYVLQIGIVLAAGAAAYARREL
jgi:ABC-type transport system involved in multi-copper enzyme maturation permease subunit